MAILTIQPSAKDTFLNASPAGRTINYGSNAEIELWDKVDNALRSILEFDIPSLPAGATITSASLQLYYRAYNGANPSGKTAWAYKLTRTDWVELQATWNIYKAGINWTAAGGDYVTSSPSGGSTTFPAAINAWMSWNVLAIIQDAYNASKPAEFLVRYETESLSSPNDSEIAFHSKEYTVDTTLRPKLVIEYIAFTQKTISTIIKNRSKISRKIESKRKLSKEFYLKVKKMKMQILRKIKKLIQLMVKLPKKSLEKRIKIRIKLITKSLKLNLKKVNKVNLVLISVIKRNIKLKLKFLFNILLRFYRFKFEATKVKQFWVQLKFSPLISKRFHIRRAISVVILLLLKYNKSMFTKLFSKILLISKKIIGKEKIIRNNLLLVQKFVSKNSFIRRNYLILNNLIIFSKNIYMIRYNLIVYNLIGVIKRIIVFVRKITMKLYLQSIVDFYVLIERTFKPIINLISSSISYYVDVSGKRILKFIRDRKNTKLWRTISGDYD